MSFHVYTPQDYIDMPWKNGLGTTTELARGDIEESGQFAWRLSIAGVVEDGAFSVFSGYDRTLVLLRGNGMTLQSKNGPVNRLAHPLAIAKFSGDDLTCATLHDGGITDFNVMARRDMCSADVQIFTAPHVVKVPSRVDELFVFAALNPIAIELKEAARIDLPAHHLFRLRGLESDTLCVTGAPSIVIQFKFADR